jgi:hypothetical protein
MDGDMRDVLADAFLPGDTQDTLRVREGSVTSDDPLEVSLAGQDGLSAARVQNYTPIIGDTVLILQTGTSLIVIDQLAFGG